MGWGTIVILLDIVGQTLNGRHAGIGPKDQTRNLEIPGSMLRIAHGMSESYGLFGSNRFSSPFQQSA